MHRRIDKGGKHIVEEGEQGDSGDFRELATSLWMPQMVAESLGKRSLQWQSPRAHVSMARSHQIL